MKYLIANWKANKNLSEVNHWVEIFSQNYKPNKDLMVIIAPPYPYLTQVKEKINGLNNVVLASQDISQFPAGSYTGEVAAKTISGLVDYVILGHSERRRFFKESDEVIEKKVIQTHKENIKVVLCVSKLQEKLLTEVEMIAYEPLDAIGTGNNATLEEIFDFKVKLKLNPTTKFLYGGSVDDKNVIQYLKTSQIDGLLVGGASLDPDHFLRLTKSV